MSEVKVVKKGSEEQKARQLRATVDAIENDFNDIVRRFNGFIGPAQEKIRVLKKRLETLNQES